MQYTKPYYQILGLAAPSHRFGSEIENESGTGKEHEEEKKEVLKKAYRVALLSAHPDKNAALKQDGPAEPEPEPAAKSKSKNKDEAHGKGGTWTVDDVKEAYTVLSDAVQKAAYDGYLSARFASGEEALGRGGTDAGTGIGMEVLDLSDFETSVGYASLGSAPASPSTAQDEARDAGGVVWTRQCRCGAARGFVVGEGQLESAEGRGESEVLVGCEGCSLWVRVGFDVEVADG